jgi:hypothetical protein
MKTVGYEPRQILLLHANQLEADHIGDLLDLMHRRGYTFITLEDALSDPAYGLPDTYIGVEGTGWLDHWAITQGHPPEGAPVFPQWVIAVPVPSGNRSDSPGLSKCDCHGHPNATAKPSLEAQVWVQQTSALIGCYRQ